LRFHANWQGKNPDPERETEVRLLWTSEWLYCDFAQGFVEITVFSDASPMGAATSSGTATSRKVFCNQTRHTCAVTRNSRSAKRFFWIDLDIAPSEKHDLKSGLRRRVILNEAAKGWVAELALPMKWPCGNAFDPAAICE